VVNDAPIIAENDENNSYQFIDEAAEKGKNYYYKLICTNKNGRIINFYSNEVSYGFVSLLYCNYPNPISFRADRALGTTIRFELGEKANGSLEIFNIKGQKVRSWDTSTFGIGEHSIVWDGKDETSNKVTSGIYLYRLVAGKTSQTRKMLIIK